MGVSSLLCVFHIALLGLVIMVEAPSQYTGIKFIALELL